MSFDWFAFAAECPVPIVAARNDGGISFANRAAGRLLGRGLADVEAAGMAALLPARLHPAASTPAGQPPGRGWIERIVELTRRPNGVVPLVPLLHAGGAEIEVEWTVLPGHDPSGRNTLVLAFSPRQVGPAAEPDIPHASASQLHAVMFEHAPAAIFHTDGRGVVTACNERFIALVGSTRAEAVGLNTRALPNRAIVQAIEVGLGGNRAGYEGDYQASNGGKKGAVRVTIEPIRGPDSDVVGVVGLVEDVTQQRSVADQAARAERLAALGVFAAGVAHEVQNPLSTVAASVDFALRLVDEGAPGSSGARLRQALLDAREGVARVATICRDLRLFGRSDDVKRGPVDVAASLDSALGLMRDRVEARARLEVRVEDVPPVWASEARMVRLFVNLLANAVEAIPEGQRAEHLVTVTVRSAGARVGVEVEDTGRGIPKEDAERVFEPFWSERTSGPGLGLSTCHGIVSSLGGEIHVDTDRPADARGAKLLVLLPVESEDDDDVLTPDPPPASLRPPARGRVLVVDDEERLASTLKLALSHAHDVDVALRGRAALESLAKHDYDVILCDLTLPDLSGVDVYLEAIHARPALAPRFVFLTGGAFQDRTRAFLGSVSNVRLDKPFELDALERLVAEQVRAARVRV